MPFDTIMKKTGIYKITCKITNDFYIGSSINIYDRWRRHKKELRKNKHHSIILQRAWNKYGETNFIFEIIQECLATECISIEQNFLDSLRPIYNICKFTASRLGCKDSEETKNKKRIASLKNGNKPPKSTWELKQKSVVMLNDLKEPIKEFISLSEACRFVGKNATFVSCITRAIKLKTKSYNYYWDYKLNN